MPVDTLVPISALPQAVVLNPWDILPIVQGGVTMNVSVEKFPGAAGSPGLQSDTGSATFVIPAGKWLASFAIRSTVDGTFDLTIVPGAADQLDDEPLVAGTWAEHTRTLFGGDTGRTIYFENLTGFVEVKLFLLG